MDHKDRLILQALDKNVRQSYRQIGKKTRLAEETVQYRIKRMIKEEIITGFWGVPRLGNNIAVYKILLKNKSLSSSMKKSLREFILSSRPVSWAAETDGTWNYIITIMGKDWEAAQTMVELTSKFSKYLADIQILKSVSATSLNEKYIHDKPHVDIRENSFLAPQQELDKTDSRIVTILSSDSRASATIIGERVGLTPEAAARRIKKIIKNDVMQCLKVRINHAKLGKTYFHLLISFSDPHSKTYVKQYWESHPACVFIMEHVGKYQMHLELVETHDKVNQIMEDFITQFPEALSDYEICPISKELKIEPNTLRK